MCEVVKSHALGKEFFVCREHKVECISEAGCDIPTYVALNKAMKVPSLEGTTIKRTLMVGDKVKILLCS